MPADVPDPALLLARIQMALLPLVTDTSPACWNLAEIADLLPDRGLVPAAVLVGLVPRADGLQVLLTRRNDDMRHHAGQVSFPGGRIESSDCDACAAALRETFEEVGLDKARITPLGWLDPLATITGFAVRPLVATITPDYVARPDPREVAEVFEVPLDHLMTASNLRHKRIDWRGRPREVLEYVADDRHRQRIWGATASILYNLRQRLENA